MSLIYFLKSGGETNSNNYITKENMIILNIKSQFDKSCISNLLLYGYALPRKIHSKFNHKRKCKHINKLNFDLIKQKCIFVLHNEIISPIPTLPGGIDYFEKLIEFCRDNDKYLFVFKHDCVSDDLCDELITYHDDWLISLMRDVKINELITW